jgi:hypothetical protein
MPKLPQTKLRGLIKKTGRHGDGGGLYFRVIGGGKAYFVYRYRVGGGERETSLGPFPELTLAERVPHKPAVAFRASLRRTRRRIQSEDREMGTVPPRRAVTRA